ncbi:hypothetical protein NLI96_g12406 [Meripilus lineatus]|uniref:Uncharacterized protein n=1 Tax=Meripilus lineatus TaxID=2056292 RepID=A0AAD5UPX7_9APHY|nr:hypothetical protein NLI96_g12406 [Physisporinus lineatus]
MPWFSTLSDVAKMVLRVSTTRTPSAATRCTIRLQVQRVVNFGTSRFMGRSVVGSLLKAGLWVIGDKPGTSIASK